VKHWEIYFNYFSNTKLLQLSYEKTKRLFELIN